MITWEAEAQQKGRKAQCFHYGHLSHATLNRVDFMGLGGENGFSESDLSASIYATGCPPPYSSSVKYRLILATHLAEKIFPMEPLAKLRKSSVVAPWRRRKMTIFRKYLPSHVPFWTLHPSKTSARRLRKSLQKASLSEKKKTGTTVVQTIVPVVGREKAYDKQVIKITLW